MLLHHHDIEDLLQVRLCSRPDSSLTLVQGGEEKLRRLLSESRVAVNIEVDENGGKSGSRIVSS